MLGDAEVIASIPVPEIDAYHGDSLHGRRTSSSPRPATSSTSGSSSWRSAWSSPRPGRPRIAAAGELAAAGRLGSLRQKDTEQYHICFGAPGITRADERRFALAVLDSIFGGSTSSRLFREVREKRGLAYAVGSYSEQYTDSGLAATYVGTREDNVEEACSIIGAELERLRTEPVSEEELARAKEHVKGRLVLSSESTAARMSRIARAPCSTCLSYTLDEMIEKVEDGDGRRPDRAGRRRSMPASASRPPAVGREEKLFRGAAPSVSETLVAA